MSLTSGRGPLSTRPAGRFSAPLPAGVVYVEPFRRRVRGVDGGRTVIDSERVLLVHRAGHPPSYAIPAGDVHGPPSAPEPEAPGYVSVPWDAVEAWYEEDERVHLHPRNPYHRVDSLRTHRRLRVEVAGVELVDSTQTVAVYETALEPRLYVDREGVRMDLLEKSSSQTYCPYKGTATYWTAVCGDVRVEDVAWTYEDPMPESSAIARLLSFDESRATVRHDLPPG